MSLATGALVGAPGAVMRGARLASLLAPLVALSGCTGIQSILAPGGRGASEIASLWWYMFGAGMAILSLVVALYGYALLTRPEHRRKISPDAMIIAGGVALPIICFSILLPLSFAVDRMATAAAPPNSMRLDIQGNRFWWRIQYIEPDRPDLSFTVANEIHLPAGRHVEIFLTSADVIHSFWVPGLAGKLQLIPGLQNRLVLEPTTPGIYRGQCSMYCGLSHAKMALYVIVQPPAEFDAWRARQLENAAEPTNELARAGYIAFRTHACVFCHTVRGLGSWGRVGPDLTHVGNRLTIAAGTFATDPHSFVDWIANNQSIKPENKMLSFAALGQPTLQSIAVFLEGLK